MSDYYYGTEQVERAIDKYFGDTSRSLEETRDGLAAVRDKIETLLEALDADIQNQ